MTNARDTTKYHGILKLAYQFNFFVMLIWDCCEFCFNNKITHFYNKI